MASGTRSSKRKSSPSLKKKRRTKDGSKKRRKIGTGKSKRVSRPEVSDSYSDDESLSSGSSVLCSSTDEDRRRSRSRTRKEKSTRKKKSRRSPMRSESREDAVHDRRGKRSKKSKETNAKKKRVRRKRRREPSVSSDSRSISCSTCRSSDDSERGHDKTEKRVKRRGRSKRVLDDDRNLRLHRSRSPSSSRLNGGDGSYVSEKQDHDEKNNPRRLRSVIIYAKDYEEAGTDLLERDVQKEEIIYDHDDYPSPKSNDSNEGDSKREACPVETGYLEDQHDEMGGSKVSVTDLCDLSVMEHDVNTCALEETEASVSSANDGSSAANLEAVLRQKALENLRKFKGRIPANAKKPVSTKCSYGDGQVKEILSGPHADVESQKKNEDGSDGGVGGLKKSAAQSVQTMPQNSEMVNPSEKQVEADKLAKQVLPTQESSELNVVTTQSLPLPSEDDKGLINKTETGASTLLQCQESSMPMSVPAQNKETVHDTKMVTDVEKTTGASNSLASNSEGQISNVTGKVDEGSQFQQKTMSVMRGGEMVQVSYKVYIPKHAPALARRKLRR